MAMNQAALSSPLFLFIGAIIACGGSATSAETGGSEEQSAQTGDRSTSDGESSEEGPIARGANYELQYPSGWSMAETPPSGVDSLANAPRDEAGDFQESINVVIRELPQPMTTPEFGMAVTSSMHQAVKGFELISTNEVRLESGGQAMEIVYKSNYETEIHHIAVMLTDKENRGYIITAASTPNNFKSMAPTLRTSLRSFKLANE